jgi:hypothetical protein
MVQRHIFVDNKSENRTRSVWFPHRASYCRHSVLGDGGIFPSGEGFPPALQLCKCGSCITSIVLAVTGSWTRAQNVNKLWSNAEDTNEGNKGRDRSNEVGFIRNGLSNCDSLTLAAFTGGKQRSLYLLFVIGLLNSQRVLLRDRSEDSMMYRPCGCSLFFPKWIFSKICANYLHGALYVRSHSIASVVLITTN